MGYSIYGAGAAMVLVATVATVSAIDNANWEPTTASISYIDRNCQIVETAYDQDYKPTKSRTFTDACNSIDEWEKVRTKRNKVVDGKAVVHIDFIFPHSGQPGTAELKFTGRDDEFYQMKAGDELNILVNKDDPTKVRKA